MTGDSRSQPTTGHTLLPWAVSSHDGQPSRGWIKSICKGFPERMVAQVLGQSTVEEREANAALIVEAVNSHAALTARVSELERALRAITGCYVPRFGGKITGLRNDVGIDAPYRIAREALDITSLARTAGDGK